MIPSIFHRVSRGTIGTDPIAKGILLPRKFTIIGLFIGKLRHVFIDALFPGNINLAGGWVEGANRFSSLPADSSPFTSTRRNAFPLCEVAITAWMPI